MDWMNEYLEEEAAKRRAEAEAQDRDPAYQERMAKKKKEDFERGARLGWWDAEGNPIDDLEADDEENEEGEEE